MSNIWNDQTPPGFTVQRVTDDNSGGDFVRGRASGDGRQNALRYKVRKGAPSVASAKVALKSTLTAVCTGYGTIEIAWTWPKEYADWTEVAIVRSGFGHPSTVNDGETVFPKTGQERTDTTYTNVKDATIYITDDQLTPGRWYYYTLFFFKKEWEPVMFADALTPRNFQHYEHLWNGIPEYYRWVDSRFRGEQGHLQQFLKLFGFELDLTREYIESWQEVYNIDNCPQPLLFQVGLNLGVDTDQGLGEIRTRSLLSQINQLYDQRGTVGGLRSVVEASSKYVTTVTPGRNLLLLPDDSEYITGSGNWAIFDGGLPRNLRPLSIQATGMAFDALCVTTGTAMKIGQVFATGVAYNASVNAASLPSYGYVNLFAPYVTHDRAVDAGYGVMTVNDSSPTGTVNTLTWACGYGVTSPMNGSRLLTPKFHGVSVDQDTIYGFSCFFKGYSPTYPVQVGIMWFDRNEFLLGTTAANYVITGTWQELLVQGLAFLKINGMLPMGAATATGTAFDAMCVSSVAADRPMGVMKGYATAQAQALDALCFVNEHAPTLGESQRTVYSEYAGATYAVPFVSVSGRNAGDDYLQMGSMFYEVGPGGTTTALSPDFYLTVFADTMGTGAGRVLGS